MKIAIPVEKDLGLESPVYGHFGSAPFFAVFDGDDGSLQIFANSNESHAHGKCQPIAELTALSVQAVVCQGMGMRAIINLQELGISVFLSDDGRTVQEIADSFKKGALRKIDAADACQHHSCH